MKLLEVLGALIIMMMLLPSLANLWVQGSDEMAKRQAADQLAVVNKAAAGYVRKHQTTLLTQTTANSGPNITTADLVAGNFLPVGFAGRNVWGQTYRIYFRQPSANSIQAVVLTTDGQGVNPRVPRFASAIVPSAAAMVGGTGGFIPTGDMPGQTSNMLQGAFGGWSLDLASVGIPSPGAAHLGALSIFDSSSLGQDFLYRVAVPGHPELNQMQTEIDMTDHSIRNLHEAQFTPRALSTETCDADTEGRIFLDAEQGFYVCRNGRMEIVADSGNSTLLKSAFLAVDGQMVDKPVCASGSSTIPQIFVSPTIVAAGAEAPPITSFQAWATDASATQWQVHLRLLTTDDNLGWVNPAPNYGRILVYTTCAKGP
jgi:type II secretory pathway pseudopilin PulG